MFKQGRGVEQSNESAFKWYEKAAYQGMVAAQRNVGLMYYEGRGVKLSPALAAHWLRKAAHEGDHCAQCYVQKIRDDGHREHQTQSETWYHKRTMKPVERVRSVVV